MRHSLRGAKDRVEVEDTLRQTIGQALGGIAVLFGAGFGLVQFLDQRDTAQKQIQASHDLLVSNQIAKGFEQLGSQTIEVRLGGIYALEGILHMQPSDNTSSPDYREPVLEALCAFVREHTKTAGDGPTTDVQAVLTVIGRRFEPEGPGPVPAKLGYVDLFGAHLEHADRSGIQLEHANLIHAHLDHAPLEGDHLEGAELTFAELSGATLFGADLSGAYLYHAHLDDANLSGANLSDANLSDADLSGAELIHADLDGADLTDVRLERADLRYAYLGLARNLTREQLAEACGIPAALPEDLKDLRLPPCPKPNPYPEPAKSSL